MAVTRLIKINLENKKTPEIYTSVSLPDVVEWLASSERTKSNKYTRVIFVWFT